MVFFQYLSTRQDEWNKLKLDGVASSNYVIPLALPVPSADSSYHIVLKYLSRKIKRAQIRWSCVVLLRLFLWPPSSSIIRPWLPHSIKVLV